ncbi:ileal sodium/bile acid cotransporter-like [Neocloeon triangulifer]|uniref:ileal sodium/bile acid cotransporter-like n=1 Tax=Neocloeon triangulifer TaxID=2078957 RepID=UPI00286F5265|nr:ileal sodium/bile acid cotransporter-like [Neocloeon triangulifer]
MAARVSAVVLALLALCSAAASMEVTFNPSSVKQLKELSSAIITVWANESFSNFSIYANSTNPVVAQVSTEPIEFLPTSENFSKFKTNFSVYGNFLGYSKVFLQAYPIGVNSSNGNPIDESAELPVSVIRVKRLADQIFIITVPILVSLIYINFGCALNWTVVKNTLKRPIGPAIGFVSQFVFMPLISFGLARYLFPNQPALQLGLFFTGCSPGGGASNIWTVALNGNLDLSITMTAISTFASFAMIPFWVFTLGHVIFEEANLGVPYNKIATIAVGLLVPLIIGTLIQFHLPRVSKFLVKILKPFAVFLIIFIVGFATITNLHLFSFMDWRVFVGGICVPWLGYIFGALLARILRQSGYDIIAISVETGVQNTGISIYLLKFALEAPESDIAQVCPVAVALMTPIPLAILSLIFRIWDCKSDKHLKGAEKLSDNEVETPPDNNSRNTDPSSIY